MAKLEGKVALVTGGTSGIGRGAVERLVDDGAKVIFTGSNEKAAAEVTEKTGALFHACRVEDPAGWDAIVKLVKDKFGRLDIAFANAGMEAGDGNIETIEVDAWDRMIAVNLTGVMLTCKAAVKLMKDNPEGPTGSIIVNSSMNAHLALGNFIAYTTTKGALITLTKSVAVHCASQGWKIRANTIHPGVVETAMIKGIIDKSPDPAAARKAYEGMAPLKRMAMVEEVTALMAFLGSDEAAFITGSEYSIDGGIRAGMLGV